MSRYNHSMFRILLAVSLGVVASGCGLFRGGDSAGPQPRWEETPPYEAAEQQKEQEVEKLAQEVPSGVYRLKVGDVVSIIIRSPAAENFEMAIDENGQIKLPYIDTVPAVGLTPTELESRIKRTYLDKKIFRMVTVNVFVPLRSYFVRGEARSPGRFPLTAGMTLVQAIATAGGFTEFADQNDVRVIRGERRLRYSVRKMEANPEEDIAIEAGDVIVVTRKIF
ncbi:MAG: polysaccharide export protein [Kiritimatiellae bacterium]|nr:polysaccharide export protein [Kiritimatiellia bacterium]